MLFESFLGLGRQSIGSSCHICFQRRIVVAFIIIIAIIPSSSCWGRVTTTTWAAATSCSILATTTTTTKGLAFISQSLPRRVSYRNLYSQSRSFGSLVFATRSLGIDSAVRNPIRPLSSSLFHSRTISTSSTLLLAMAGTDNDPSFKRARLDEKPASDKVIGTHSGTFQADEAMGVFLLRQLPDYRRSKVVRSRDPQVLDPLDIVIDVGGVYDHSKLRYDHHQRGYDERFDGGKNNDGTPEGEGQGRITKLSASGLVYRHYGKHVLKEFYPALSEEHVDLAYVKIYDKLLEALDAIDTGVEMVPEGVEVLYRDSTGLSSRVGRLNPRWNEVDESTGQKPDHDERFEKAVELCGQDFVSVMTQVVESDIPARKFVEEALLKRHETDSSGEIICFAHGGLPWRDHLYELEKIHKIDPLVKFVLYQDVSDMWRVQAVTVEGRGFENRLSLPAAWRGVRDQDLASVTNIPGSRFVHAAGFIGGADTYEGVLAMAKVALATQDEK